MKPDIKPEEKLLAETYGIEVVKCDEIYNYITENFNQYEVTDYLFYDYSTELLLINKSGDLYCNKDLSFFEIYDKIY